MSRIFAKTKYRPITVQPDGRIKLDDDVAFYLHALRQDQQVLAVRRGGAIHFYSLARHAELIGEVEDLIPEEG